MTETIPSIAAVSYWLLTDLVNYPEEHGPSSHVYTTYELENR